MEVIFKDVGQGDSVILLWGTKKKKSVGIIDCKQKSKTDNPCIAFLSTLPNVAIKFILLSHPHSDHFSGLLDLLNFCEDNKIYIERFYHTLIPDYRYLEYANFEEKENVELLAIIQKVRNMEDRGLIQAATPIALDTTIELKKDVLLKCLSPSDYETAHYCQSVDYLTSKNLDYQCGQAANHLSTIIKIQNKKKYVLLTSDAALRSFARVLFKFEEELKKVKLCLGQVAHHGSPKNYFSKFWERIAVTKNCPAVISVGKNIHGHPSYDVVKSLKDIGYDVMATTIINGIKDLVVEIKFETTKTEMSLDEISELLFDDEEIISSDLTFSPFSK